MACSDAEVAQRHFMAPVPPAPAVTRARLDARIDAAVRGKLTLVVAPAGWGKSTAVAQWALRRGAPVAWLQCEPGDDDRALAERVSDALVALGAPTAAPLSGLDPASVRLLAEQSGALGESYLVLDGAAQVAPSWRAPLGSFIARSAPSLHVVVTSRTTDVFEQATDHLRVADEVAYIRARDLAFDRRSACDLVFAIAGHTMSDDDADALLTMTRGWPVALYFAALAARDAPDDPRLTLARFGAHDERLAAYCRNELVSRYSAGVSRLLHELAPLERVTATLCDAITGDVDGADRLRRLELDGLIERFDDDWYAYHPLWRAALRADLRANDRDAERRLLGIAAQWHLDRNEIDEAAQCLIGAGEWDRLVALVDTHAQAMFERARPARAAAWIDAIPAEVRRRDPRLVLQRAVLLSMAGQTHAAEQVVRELGDRTRLAPEWRVAVEAVRSTWNETHLEPDQTVDAARYVLGTIDTVEPAGVPQVIGVTTIESLRTIANASLARAHWQVGDARSARTILRESLAAGDTYLPWRHVLLGNLALTEATTGRLNVADRHARHALRVAAETGLHDHPSIVDARIALGHVLRERDELDAAEALLLEARDLASRVRRSNALAILAAEIAHLDLEKGYPQVGLEVLQQFRASGHGEPRPFVAARQRAVEARCLIAVGHGQRAARVLAYDPADATAEVASVAAQLAFDRLDAAGGEAILDGWPDDGEHQSELARRAWRAVLADARGERDAALEQLGAVVHDAEDDGHVGLFLDMGASMQRLLRALFHADPSPYLRSLARPERPVPLADAQPGRAPLSTRELLVLRYLPSRLTNAEIAGEMFVSLNTVKTYVKSIYTKLGVNTRREAIARAEELGLV